MEKRGNKVYLTLPEQVDSGYPSPIDLERFDLHAERVAADASIDRLNDLGLDESQLPRHFHSELKQARTRSEITRWIAKQVAIEAAGASVDDELRSLTQ